MTPRLCSGGPGPPPARPSIRSTKEITLTTSGGPRSGPRSSARGLAARAVVKRYGSTTALDRVTLHVEPGEVVVLVGESGSGKTTLLRLFNGLVRPDAGRVSVGDREVPGRDVVALRRTVGYVPQEGGLLPHWTVARNAALVPDLLGLPDAAERAREALSRVGLDPARFGPRHPRTLSGGERQRVALARALAAGPDVILLDEPFGALDALTRGEILDVFAAVLEDGGVTALVVTHDLRVAGRLGHRVGVMKEGRLLQCDGLEALTTAPADPYVTGLLRKGGLA